MSEEKKVNEELYELDKEFVEMVNKAENAKELSKEEISELLEKAKASTEFLKLIDNIKIPEEKYVVYTDGNIQLIYENGEFFMVSTTDSNGEKKKITRKKAIDSYLEYFIKYQINPIITKRKQAMLKREKQIAEKTKTRRKTSISKEVENKEKVKAEKEEVTIKVETEKGRAKTVTTKKVVEHDDLSL